MKTRLGKSFGQPTTTPPRARLLGLVLGWLMVLAAPTAWADCQPAPNGLVSWWAADGSAADLISTNHGTLQGGATATLPAYVDRGFSFDGTNGFVTIPDSPALKPALFTIETWVKFDSLFSQTTGAAAGVQFLVHKQNTRPNNWFSAYALLKNASHRIGFDLISSNQTEVFLSSSSTVQTGVWYHVVGVRGSNSAQLYINGTLAQQASINFASDYGNYPLYLGTSGHPTYNGRLNGQLDEVTLYQRALSASEITALYAAGTEGKCSAPKITLQPQPQTAVVDGAATFTVTATGLNPLHYQWRLNETPLPGATNATLTVPNITLAQAGNYSVIISNTHGWMISSNAWLEVLTPPQILTVSPRIATPGTTVTISGINFSTTPTNNIVHFGAVRASVTAASSNSLTVIVPTGATFAPISVNVGGSTALAPLSFQPTFIGNGNPMSSSTFATGQNLSAGDGPHRTLIADLDGDGWPDLIVANVYGHTLSLYRNLGTGGPLTPSSFGARVDLPPLSGTSDNPYGLVSADIDGDGKLDLIFTDRDANRIGIYRNQSSIGTLETNSFAPPIYFDTGADPRYVRVADLDRDGRLDIVACNFNAGTVSILRNLSPAGILDASTFTTRVDLNIGTGAFDVAIQDLEGDGRPDLAVVSQYSATVALFRNISIPGILNASSFAPRVDLPANGDATIVAGDLDGDGKPELISGGNSALISVFRNISVTSSITAGSFAPKLEYGNPGWVHNIALGDVNGDGKPDVIAVGELGSYLRVYPNQSTPGTVTLAAGVDYATGWNAWGVSVGDLDGDRRNDIVFCNAYDDTLTLYRNQQVFGIPPFITTPPSNQVVVVSNNITFNVAAGGTAPLSYQWLFNGTNLLNATSSVLSLNNVPFAQAGDYSVLVSNTFGVVTSSIATLTVIPPSCVPASFGLVGWWQAEGNALDAAGGNSSVLSNGLAFGIGHVGQSFSFSGSNDFVRIAPSAALNVGTNAGLTLECWINPATASGSMPLVEWSNPAAPSSGGAHFWTSVYSQGSLFVNLVDTTGNSHPFSSASGLLVENQFQHVAITYDKTSGLATFYYNGTPAGNQNLGIFTPQTSYHLFLGHRPTGGNYQGQMDEVGVYNRALTAGEIQTLWQATSLGRCPMPPVFLQPLPNPLATVGSDLLLTAVVAGSQPASFQWYFGNVALTNSGHHLGTTASVLTIANLQTSDAGNYWLVASNLVGVSTSSIAVVTVGHVPSFLLQPVGQTNMASSTITFLTAVSGTEPFSFQWYQNTIALTNDVRRSGATSTNLTITDLVTGDSGNYTLRASNLFGVTTSAVATLSVPVPPSITTQPRGYSVPVGLPVTLTAAATGGAPLRYQWVLNGTAVPRATNTSLTISNLALANFGNYQLVVTNGGGAVTSIVASVTLGTVATWGSIGQVASFPIWPAAGLSNVIAVSAGQNYSLALRQDGTVYYWGNNNQVSNTMPNLSGVVGFAAGPSHALAVLSNGTVRAWGVGTSGQTNVPVTLSNVIAVAAGSAHSAALRADGTVVVWGGSSVEAQTNVPAGLMKVTSIDAGGSQTMAQRENGSLIVWGGRTQYPVPLDIKSVSSFSTGPGASALYLALTTNGLVRAWGFGGAGTNVPPNLTGIIAVEAAGSDNNIGVALALRSNRTVTAWGSSYAGLTNIPTGLSNVLSLAGGASHVLALTDNGRPLIIQPPVGGTFYSGRDLTLKAKIAGKTPLSLQWFKDGNPIPGGTEATLVLPFAQANDAGSYHLVASNALGTAQSVVVPVTVVDRSPGLMSSVQSRFAYYGSPFSVGASVIGSGPIEFTWLQNGTPVYFDTNDLVFDRALPQHGGSYQLIVSNPFGSITSAVAQITFSRVASWGNGPSLTNAPVDLGSVLGVASGYFHALAIRSNGTVVAWGNSQSGSTNVPPDLENVRAVAGGNYFSVALKNDGTVVAWGLHTSGQTNVPVGLSNVTAIAVGGNHTLALRADGTVAAWGGNGSGQTNVPASLNNVVVIAAGSVHSLALRNNGTIVGWGGVGKIPNYTNVVALAAGYGQSLALQADGTVLGWSTSGAATLLPAGLSNVVAISIGGGWQGFFHGAALKADGTVTTWGNNGNGQLNGLPELTSASAISAGGGSTLAYLNDRSPIVATQPLDRHAVSGSNVTFAALSVGLPALNFQWRLNGDDIPGATGATFTLSNVSRASRGLYSALVWNSLSSTNSRDAWLDVVGPVQLLSTSGSSPTAPLSFLATDSTGGLLPAEDAAWLEVQASTNLVNWQIIPTALIFTNGTLLLQDPAQTNHPRRFYRLIER